MLVVACVTLAVPAGLGALPAQAAAKQQVSIRASTNNVQSGHTFTITGAVTLAKKGQSVRLMVFSAGAFRKTASTSLDAKLHYKFTVRAPLAMHTYRYKTVSAQGTQSKVVAVSVHTPS